MDPVAGHRFSKLREDAWDRFLDKSVDLAAAHQHPRTALERECGPVLRPWVRVAKWFADRVKNTRRSRSKASDSRRSAVPAPPRVRVHPVSPAPRPRSATAAIRTESAPGREDRMAAPAVRSARLAAALSGARRARAELAASRGAADGRFIGRVDVLPAGGAAWA